MDKFKSFFLSVIFLGLLSSASSQNPVSWNFKVETADNNTYKLIASADIEKGWVLYSQHTGEDGPIPTSFTFDTNDALELEGDVIELSRLISGFDPLFDTEVKKFKNKAVFEALFKKKRDGSTLSGSVRFMTCDGLRCLPPTDVQFDLAL